MIKAVLAANVWVSGLISPKGPPGQIIDLWLADKFQVAISPPILFELLRVFQYPRIKERIKAEDLHRLFAAIVEAVDLNLGKTTSDLLTMDPDDNIYLACAIESKAKYLVTGNLKHFEEAGEIYEGVRILSLKNFLENFRRFADIP
jgi:putative PIN family toxin of toxin-antitoxin system